MKNFNLIYKKIVEEEDIFKASTPEEGTKRKEEYVKIMIKELIDSGKAKLNVDGSYDIEGNVNLFYLGLTKFPVKFNKVSGSFYCSSNKLTTLEGAPREVGGDFYCDFNKLTTLEGAPREVSGDFLCYHNPKRFTEDEVRAVCNVKGQIYV